MAAEEPETKNESSETSQTVANVDHATTNGAEEDGETGAEQGGESIALQNSPASELVGWALDECYVKY